MRSLYANNIVNGSFSELYHANSTGTGDNNSAYDRLNRLTSFSRGTLTPSGNNGSGLDTITSANLNSTSGVPNQNSWTRKTGQVRFSNNSSFELKERQAANWGVPAAVWARSGPRRATLRHTAPHRPG